MLQQKQQNNDDEENNGNVERNSTSSHDNNEKFELRLLIDTKWANVIDGIAEELSAKYNAAVLNVLDQATPECVLSIRCPAATIEPCVADVLAQMNSDEAQEVRLLIHRSHADALVANGNKVLGDLYNRIHVATKCCSGSTERICHIMGDNSINLPGAIKQLIVFLARIPVEGQRQLYKPKNPRRYRGFGRLMTPLVASRQTFPPPAAQRPQQQQPLPMPPPAPQFP